jgi:hypothetical protein
MKRVTASKQRDELDSLKVLAALLNFDWEGGDARQVEKVQRDVRIFYGSFIEDALKDRAKAKSVLEELRADLLAILSPEGDVDPEKAYFLIRKLLRKFNEIESKTVWEIDPIEYEWASVITSEAEPDTVLMPLPPAEVESKYLPFNPVAEINLLGYRWQFGGASEGVDFFSFSRDAVYQMVLDAFKSGAIERLRTCPHCKAFFVADDARQQFCSDEHRNEFNNKQRLAGTYFRDLRQKKRRRQITRARQLLQEGKSPKEIASKTKLSLRVLKREGVIRDS